MTRIPSRAHDYYHLYNRGVDNRTLFATRGDFDRFKAYLYLLNDEDAPRAANFFASDRKEGVYESARGQKLVAIGAYSLMPNHFHILASSLVENGIARFMQKVLTAYTMYFNERTLRSGSLFQGTYKRTRTETETDLKYLYAYIHLSPAKYFHDDWRAASMEEFNIHERKLMTYPYSSANEYLTSRFVIASPEYFPRYMTRTKDLQSHLKLWFKHKEQKGANPLLDE